MIYYTILTFSALSSSFKPRTCDPIRMHRELGLLLLLVNWHDNAQEQPLSQAGSIFRVSFFLGVSGAYIQIYMPLLDDDGGIGAAAAICSSSSNRGEKGSSSPPHTLSIAPMVRWFSSFIIRSLNSIEERRT